MSLDREELFAELIQPIEAWDEARHRINELFDAARKPLLTDYYSEQRRIDSELVAVCTGLIDVTKASVTQCKTVAPEAAQEKHSRESEDNFAKCCAAQKPLVAAQEAALGVIDNAIKALFQRIAAVVQAEAPALASANDHAIRTFETFLTTKETQA